LAKRPETPLEPTRWTVYKIAAKQIRLGTVEPADEREAIQQGGRRVQTTGNEALCWCGDRDEAAITAAASARKG
jgi:hypothetical protein